MSCYSLHDETNFPEIRGVYHPPPPPPRVSALQKIKQIKSKHKLKNYVYLFIPSKYIDDDVFLWI